jgi:serine/threonine protein kinase
MDPGLARDFRGTERFSVIERLGEGAFGTVYRVFDRERGVEVALKSLRRVDPSALYRFKREFRSLADVTHPNLVALHELFADDGEWYFTMELVVGVDFFRWVWGEAARTDGADAGERRASTQNVRVPAAVLASQVATLPPRAPPPYEGTAPSEDLWAPAPPEVPAHRVSLAALPVDLARVREPFLQLVEGVDALHRARKLHRDIKPSNVLVTAAGRVVLLDFGLVTDADPVSSAQTAFTVGTPAYMSPEQAGGGTATEASDWYSVGVMLFEVLTGRFPFDGPALRMLASKRAHEAPPADAFVSDLPADLTDVCTGLLRRHPGERPGATEIRARLQGPVPEAPPARATPLPSERPFVGRAEPLALLRDALSRTQQGRAALVLVHAPPGVGKTALVRHFLEGVRRTDADAILLEARCLPTESVPFRALDNLVDSLSRELLLRAPDETKLLLPRNIGALARVFPVLEQVEAIAQARTRAPEIPDVREVRRQAAGALRTLLARFAERAAVILHIDDAQWAGADSLALLAEVLAPPAPPAILVVLCAREDASGARPSLGPLDELPEVTEDPSLVTHTIRLQELSSTEARALTRSILPDSVAHDEAVVERIVREAYGSPFLIEALAEMLDERGPARDAASPPVSGAETSVDALLARRLLRCSPKARALLEVVAIAGQPVARDVAAEAAGATGADAAALGELERHRLLRHVRVGARPAAQAAQPMGETNGVVGISGLRIPDAFVDVYHERIRQRIQSEVEEGRVREIHDALARALTRQGASPELLAVHYEGAGDPARAASLRLEAAQSAMEALAFERAVRLFRAALPIASNASTTAERERVACTLEGLSHALTLCGRCVEAGHAFAEAARAAPPDRALDLLRRAAEQWLVGGQFPEGLEALRHVLARIGLALPKSQRGALWAVLYQHARLWTRGLGFRERLEDALPEDLRLRIDVCWSVMLGLTMVDTVRAASFQKRQLRLALDAGEPYRIARALALEAAHTATLGSRGEKLTRRLLLATATLARRLDHPHALALERLAHGLAGALEGRFLEAKDDLAQAEQSLRERCTGVTWERDNALVFLHAVHALTGDFAKLCAASPRLLRDARERGDLYLETAVLLLFAYRERLAAGDAVGAQSALDRGLGPWRGTGFLVQHYWYMTGTIERMLYEGAGREADAFAAREWPAMARSHLLRVQFIRTLVYHTRARARIAAANEHGASERRAWLHLAAQDARRLTREGAAWSRALGELVYATIATHTDPKEAPARLAKAEGALSAARMSLFAAAAKRLRGVSIGGAQGAAWVDAADAQFRAEGIADPARFAAMFAPSAFPAA